MLFKIKTVEGMDDYASTKEVVSRRLLRSGEDIKFAKLGEKMIKEVNGKDIINKDNFEKVKEEIRRNRIEWLKENIATFYE